MPGLPRARSRGLAGALLLAALVGGLRDAAPEEEAPAPWFANVAAEVGLEGVPAKDAIFVDLDGDGWLDLFLDRQAAFRSTVRPLACTAAMSAFSVPVTLGSSRKMSPPASPLASSS